MKNNFPLTAFQAVVFFISAFLFSWPFLAISSVTRPLELFTYLFTVWFLLVFIAFLAALNVRKTPGIHEVNQKGNN